MADQDSARRLRAAVIGCGQIGSSYDKKSPPEAPAKSHAKAYANHPNFQLTGLFDISAELMREANQLWQPEKEVSSLQELLSLNNDVISICTPTTTHKEIIENVIEAKPKAIFLEKPAGRHLKDFEAIHNMTKKRHIPVILNFSRRFSAPLQAIFERATTGEWGMLQTANIQYDNGFLNNGSHALNLIQGLLGELKSCINIGAIDDHRQSGADPSLNLFLNFEKQSQSQKVSFTAHNSKYFSVMEIDLFFSHGRIQLKDSADTAIIFKIEADRDYPDYKALVPSETYINTLENVFATALDNILNVVQNNGQASCKLEDAKLTHTIIDQIGANK